MSNVEATPKSKHTEMEVLDDAEQDAVLRFKKPYADKPWKGVRQRILNLLKSNSNPQDAEYQSLESHLSLELQTYNLSLFKTLKIIQKISPQEVSSYEAEADETDLEISNTLEEIELLKEELKDEERKRMDKLQYDEISREIEKLDSREKLDESINKLQQSIRELEAENARYTELAASSKSRFEEMASNLFKLSIEIGEEVGERKRRDVDKDNENENENENEGEAEGEGEGEGEVEAEEMQGDSRRKRDDEVVGDSNESNNNSNRLRAQNESSADSNLNPSAKVFKPSGIAFNRKRALQEGEGRSSPNSKPNQHQNANPNSNAPYLSSSSSTSAGANVSSLDQDSSINPPRQLAGQKRDHGKTLVSATREEGEASSGDEMGAYEKEEGEEDEDDDLNNAQRDSGSNNRGLSGNGGRFISGNGSPMIRGLGSNGNGNGKGNLDSGLPPAKRRK